MRYFAHTPSSIESMLKTMGKETLMDLFSSIPKKARLDRKLDLPKSLDELSLKRELAPFLSPLNFTSFLGAGATAHFAPEWVSQQLLRAEWYTSYTPYQPEASQGTLQAIFEFQSMAASLLGMQVANGSMYDGATALAESMLMAVRITGKRSVILARSIHPEYREVVHNYLNMADIQVYEADFLTSGITDLENLSHMLTGIGPVASIAVQSPNFFGRIEDVKSLSTLAHEHGAMAVGVVTDLSATALFSSMGHLGADIAVGEGLGLLGSINMGGPGVGLFACKSSLIRQMPGRIVGHTTDKFGTPGYVLTLSTREQHIRREKATSNICTNHNLMALALSMVLVSYGKTGFLNLSLMNIKKTDLLRKHLEKLSGPKVSFLGPHYNETVVEFCDQKERDQRYDKALAKGLIAGVKLEGFYPELSRHLLIATTELHEDEQIESLARILSGVRDA